MTKERVFIFDKLPVEIREKMRGGTGASKCRNVLGNGVEIEGSSFISMGIHVLDPGSSVGYHEHVNDEELYLVISGQAEYTDDDGKVHIMNVGDCSICTRGEKHGIANNSNEPMCMAGIVIK